MADLLARYVLFSGCAVDYPGSPARHAAIALARATGIEFWEAPARGCCGARVDRPVAEPALRHLLTPLVEAASQGLATACLAPGCRQVIGRHLGAEGQNEPVVDAGTTRPPRACDLLELLTQPDEQARLAGSLVTSLSPLRVALHSICHGGHLPAPEPTQQPTNLSSTPGTPVESPGSMEGGASTPTGQALANLIALTGAEPLEDVSVPGRCAETPLLPRPARYQVGAPACLALAARAGVDVLVTPCFLCFGELNERQRRLDRNDPIRSVPVLHLAQLLGLACGAAPLDLELGRLAASARRVLAPFVR